MTQWGISDLSSNTSTGKWINLGHCRFERVSSVLIKRRAKYFSRKHPLPKIQKAILNVSNWHFFDLASKAAIGIEPDI